MPFAAAWRDLEMIILSKVSQRQISQDIAYMWNLKNTDKFIYETGITDIENKLKLLKGKGGREG